MQTLHISSRFRGPDVAANGGYTAGLLAGDHPGPMRVTLRGPAPMDRPLVRVSSESGVELRAGDELLAEARPAPIGIIEAEIPRVRGCSHPKPALAPEHHVFEHCFVCGPRRAQGDGLRLLPGHVHGRRGVVATAWVPAKNLSEDGTTVASRFVWAALDCPGAWAFCREGKLEPMVLGRLTADLRAPVPVEAPLTVVGWQRGIDGRKHFAGSAILEGDRVLAVAEAVWLTVPAAVWKANTGI